MDETVAIARQNGSIDDATQVVPPTTRPRWTRRPRRTSPTARSTPRTPPGRDPSAARRQAPPPSNGNGHRRRNDEPKPKGSWGGRILILLAVLALLSVIAMAQFLLKGGLNNEDSTGTDNGGTTRRPRAAVRRRRPAERPRSSAPRSFDPTPDGSGSEHPEDVANTYDGKASTGWTTHVVQPGEPRRPEAGVGIIYNLGAPTTVSKVAVTLKGDGSSVQLLIPKGDTSKSPSGAVSGWTPVATQEGRPEGTTNLTPSQPAETAVRPDLADRAAEGEGQQQVPGRDLGGHDPEMTSSDITRIGAADPVAQSAEHAGPVSYDQMDDHELLPAARGRQPGHVRDPGPAAPGPDVGGRDPHPG